MTHSFDLKLDRAERHLEEFRAAVAAYAESHPYDTVIERERGQMVRRLRFTRQPDPALAVILGDVLFDVRSALDHMAAALVPYGRRRDVMFPIYFQGVWEPQAPGDSAGRINDRERWSSIVSGMAPEAVAILKMAQPPDVERGTATLQAVKRLSNRDRHSMLVVIASFLQFPRVVLTMADGTTEVVPVDDATREDGFGDGAVVNLPDGATKVVIEGTPAVLVRDGSDSEGYQLPDVFEQLVIPLGRYLADELRPYVRS